MVLGGRRGLGGDGGVVGGVNDLKQWFGDALVV